MISGKIILLGRMRRQQMREEKTNATVFEVKPSCLPKNEFMSLCFGFQLLLTSCSLNETESFYYPVKDN